MVSGLIDTFTFLNITFSLFNVNDFANRRIFKVIIPLDTPQHRGTNVPIIYILMTNVAIS